jgi:hypothetical protein
MRMRSYMMSRRKLRLTLLMVPAVVGVILWATVVNGDAVTSGATSPSERLTDYRAPTGPELSVDAVAAKALQHARAAHEAGALKMTIGHGTFGEAHAALEGRSPSQAVSTETVNVLHNDGTITAGHDAEIEEWRQSAAYLIVMTGSKFTPAAPVPRGRKGPSGKVMGLVLDSHTGFVEEEYVGETAPKQVSEVHTVATKSVAAESQAAHVALRPNPRWGLLVGHLYVQHVLAPGWRVLIGRHLKHPVMTATTTADGTFELRAVAGQYLVAAKRPDGRLCGAVRARIVRHAEEHIAIECRSAG